MGRVLRSKPAWTTDRPYLQPNRTTLCKQWPPRKVADTKKDQDTSEGTSAEVPARGQHRHRQNRTEQPGLPTLG